MINLNPASPIPPKAAVSSFNLLTIIGHPYWVIPGNFLKIFIRIVFFSYFMWVNHGNASIISGTYITMYFDNNYVVIGSDSRGSQLEQGSRTDNVCKIVPISKQVIFFGLGITVVDGFNARDMARDAEKSVGDDTRVKDIGDRWGAITVRALEMTGEKHRRALVERNRRRGDILAGIFLSVASRRLSMYRVAITISDENVIPMKFTANGDITDRPNRIGYFGNLPASKAFIQKNTPGARDVNEAGAYIAEMVDFVEKTSGDPEVGGPIIVMILDNKTGARWFRRPEFCPQE
jgi:hypothetical protein